MVLPWLRLAANEVLMEVTAGMVERAAVVAKWCVWATAMGAGVAAHSEARTAPSRL